MCHNNDFPDLMNVSQSVEFEFHSKVDALRCRSSVGGGGVNLLLT